VAVAEPSTRVENCHLRSCTEHGDHCSGAGLDQQWTVEEQAAGGEKFWSCFTWRGTPRGEFPGIPPTGSAVTVKGIVIDRFVDGKRTESRILMDNVGMTPSCCIIPLRLGSPKKPALPRVYLDYSPSAYKGLCATLSEK
jgi:hypothetical protein